MAGRCGVSGQEGDEACGTWCSLSLALWLSACLTGHPPLPALLGLRHPPLHLCGNGPFPATPEEQLTWILTSQRAQIIFLSHSLSFSLYLSLSLFPGCLVVRHMLPVGDSLPPTQWTRLPRSPAVSEARWVWQERLRIHTLTLVMPGERKILKDMLHHVYIKIIFRYNVSSSESCEIVSISHKMNK